MPFKSSLICVLWHFRECAGVKYYLSFVIILVDLIASFSMLRKLSLAKINVSLICVPTISNGVDLKKNRYCMLSPSLLALFYGVCHKWQTSDSLILVHHIRVS